LTWRRHAPLALLMVLVIAKVLGLFAYGPLLQPDSGDYISYANLILTDSSWIHDGGMATQAVPQTVFRTFGYPLLIADSTLLGGDDGGALYLVVLVQIAASIWATAMVYRLSLALLRHPALALLAAAGHALSVTFTYDQHILTDSLFNALCVIGFSVPIIGFLRQSPPRLQVLFGLGALLGAACLVRGIGIYVLVLILPSYGAWLWVTREDWLRTGFRLVALALPLIVIIGGVMAWNNYRTGYVFFTTGAQYVMLQSLVIIEGRGTPMFDGEGPIDDLAREHLKTHTYNEVGKITHGLFTEYGIDAYHSAKMHTRRYLDALARHPRAMLYHGIRQYEGSLIYQFFGFMDSAQIYFKFAYQERPWPGTKDLWRRFKADGNPSDIVLLVALSAFRSIAWATFALLLIGPPWLAGLALLARRPWTPELNAMAYCWGLYFAYSFGLSMIHMVDRFLPAVLAAGLMGSLFTAQCLYDALLRRRIQRATGS
jgi:hypothetical protein